MKTCFKCKTALPLNQFYKHKMMADGYLNKCRACAKKDVRNYYFSDHEKNKEKERKRSSLPHRVKARKIVTERWKKDPKLRKRRNFLTKKWQERNVIKRAAHVITGHAIRDKRLFKEPCEVCKKKKVEAHLDDYTKPLQVRWLCHKHHMEHHKNERELARAQQN